MHCTRHRLRHHPGVPQLSAKGVEPQLYEAVKKIKRPQRRDIETQRHKEKHNGYAVGAHSNKTCSFPQSFLAARLLEKSPFWTTVDSCCVIPLCLCVSVVQEDRPKRSRKDRNSANRATWDKAVGCRVSCLGLWICVFFVSLYLCVETEARTDSTHPGASRFRRPG
jgi:hypothetical protein